MKRLIALLLCLCCLLPVGSWAHDGSYIGTMEVVNCQEWVSLREKPSASSPRLCKVSLGSTVRCARCFDEDWCSVAYDGYQGYIQSQYLQATEGVRTFEMMVVTNPEGAELCSDIDGAFPLGEKLPEGTVVRRCSLKNSGRMYVEYDGRCFFTDAASLTDFALMDLFSEILPLHIATDLWFDRGDAPKPTLQASFLDAGSEDSAWVQFTTSIPVGNFRLFNLDYLDISEDGYFLFDAQQLPQFSLETLMPEETMIVDIPFLGTIPNTAVSYQDHYGVTHLFLLEMSGEDGSLILTEI
ncbi:MAG: SH3 domain-containing protein [Clostridiales bacterium]|nr:SH3 domain-containing protein [Clostridiales bacterium]